MPRRGSSAAIVFALLVLATLAAFAWSQRLKRDPLVLDHVTFGIAGHRAFSPNGDCRRDRIRIRFRVTRSDHAVVQIVKPGGRLVATLARGRFLKRYHFFTFHWDGHTHSTVPYPRIARQRNSGVGVVAPPGRYKLRVKLLEQGRTLVPPGAIALHRVPPKPPGCEPTSGGSR